MAEPVLRETGVGAFVGQNVAAAVTKHVGMNVAEIRPPRSLSDQVVEVLPGHGLAAAVQKDPGLLVCPLT